MNASAVIPNWNGRRFLEPLFDDLRRQTVPPDEIIVIDNGSTDGSQEWAGSQGARVVAFPANRGFAAAVNEGVRSAQGRIVAVLNNDLRLDDRWLETVLSSIGNASFAVGKVLSLADPSRIDGTFDAVCCGGTAWRCGAGSLDGPLWSAAARSADSALHGDRRQPGALPERRRTGRGVRILPRRCGLRTAQCGKRLHRAVRSRGGRLACGQRHTRALAPREQ